MQKAFIETQFPIARLSAEAYKERKANNGQTLTRLGKWWGRKPLILVRACILGMLMPASDDPKKDREIFLKVLTMDDDGAWQRQKGEIPVKAWREAAPAEIQDKYFGARGFQRGISDEEKEFVLSEIWESLNDQQRQLLDDQRRRAVQDRSDFDQMPYSDRIVHCERPESVTGPSVQSWLEINAHLQTSATSVPELIKELGKRNLGRTPRVGDSFSGGGSIPFEAARMGCEAIGSDLNPVATLLTWSSLNILGKGKCAQEEVRDVQKKVFAAAELQVIDWGIENNELGDRADAYLYCVEVKPDGCEYYIPLATSWVIGEKSSVVARWNRVAGTDRLEPEIAVVKPEELKEYKNRKGATLANGRILDPFDPSRTWSVESLRGPSGLRRWSNEDVAPRPGDVFQERLYCIRWVNTRGERRYAAPTPEDLGREQKVVSLLQDRFFEWQHKGFIPTRPIPLDGEKTEEPIRTRGWSYWHHFFTPRQLLVHGLFSKLSDELTSTSVELAGCLLGLGRLANWDSRLCAWMQHATNEKGDSSFNNQALNPLSTYAGRGMVKVGPTWEIFEDYAETELCHESQVLASDARDLKLDCDFWVTDPPYADAISYHELGDYFLAWYSHLLARAFPDWISDSRAELAVRGEGEDFRRAMVEVYKNLASCMPDNGMQIVMFTHQDPSVWADLGMILWASGLKATAAWTNQHRNRIGWH